MTYRRRIGIWGVGSRPLVRTLHCYVDDILRRAEPLSFFNDLISVYIWNLWLTNTTESGSAINFVTPRNGFSGSFCTVLKIQLRHLDQKGGFQNISWVKPEVFNEEFIANGLKFVCCTLIRKLTESCTDLEERMEKCFEGLNRHTFTALLRRFEINELERMAGQFITEIQRRVSRLHLRDERIELKQLLRQLGNKLTTAEWYVDATEKLIQLKKDGVRTGKIAITSSHLYTDLDIWMQCIPLIEGYNESFGYIHATQRSA